MLDQVVHLGLRETWIVAFVVAAAPVADQIDHDILVESLSIGKGQSGGADAGVGIVAVDVKHRSRDGLGNIRAVGRGA